MTIHHVEPNNGDLVSITTATGVTILRNHEGMLKPFYSGSMNSKGHDIALALTSPLAGYVSAFFTLLAERFNTVEIIDRSAVETLILQADLPTIWHAALCAMQEEGVNSPLFTTDQGRELCRKLHGLLELLRLSFNDRTHLPSFAETFGSYGDEHGKQHSLLLMMMAAIGTRCLARALYECDVLIYPEPTRAPLMPILY